MKAGIAHWRRVHTTLALAFAIGTGMSPYICAQDNGVRPPTVLTQSPVPTHTLLPDGRTLILGLGGAKSDDSAVSIVSGDALSQRALAAPESVKRTQHTATVLPDGRVLIWGGLDAKGQIKGDGAWFDPGSDVFSPAVDMEMLPRAGHAATVLTDGRLLVTGGWNQKFQVLPEAELWDYRTNHSELLKGELVPPRIGHSASLLADGRVLILGGYNESGRRYSDATLYEPDQVAFVNVNAWIGESLATKPEDEAPSVAGSIPEPDVGNFPPGGLIALRFATPMDVRSLSNSTVTLMGREGSVALTAIGAESGRLLFVRPATDLYPGSRYTLFVDGAKSVAGKALRFTAIGFSTAVLVPGVAPDGSSSSTLPSGASDTDSGANPNGELSTVPPSVQGKDESSERAAASVPGELRLSTGGKTSKRRPGCPPTSAPLTSFCRAEGTAVDGLWLPGESNKGGHWRINGSYPPLPDARLLTSKSVPVGVTAIYGQVLRIDDQPVANVEVSIGKVTDRTDAQGVFVLINVPSGRQQLVVDGGSASGGGAEYGDFLVGVDVIAGVVTAVPHLLYLPRIQAQDKVELPSPTTQETVITHPEMPGLEIHIPAGTVLKDPKGHAITQLAIVPMPADRAPVPLPANFPSYFVLQPGNAVIQGLTPEAARGVRIVYPNMGGDAPGATHEFWSYAPENGWRIYGSGHVDDAAGHVVPDAGVGLHDHMGAGHTLGGGPPPATPNPPPGCGPRSGDPVDLRTGLLIEDFVDIAIEDVTPLRLTRTYRQGDTTARAFGKGFIHSYGMYLYNPNGSGNYENPTLVLPDGALVPFRRIGGTAIHDGVWLHDSTSCKFLGARLTAPTTPEEYWLITLNDGSRLEFTASSGNMLRAISDRFGNTTKIQFTAGLPSRITSPSGRYIQLTYNASNRVTQVADSIGRAVGYTYNAAGLLDTVTYPDTTTQHYTYDSTTNAMLSVVDRRSNTMVTNEYDANGRVKKQTLADNSIYTFTYTTDASGVVTSVHVVDPRNNSRDVTFDSTGYPATDKHAVGTAVEQLTTYERDAVGHVTAIVDSLNRRTEYTYDALGNRTSTKYLAGTPNQIQYSYTYTSDYNQLRTVSDPLQHTITYDYTAGCLTKITDALGHSTDITCNAAGQPTIVTDALQHSTTYSYLGTDLRTVTDALGNTTTYTTDNRGRVVAVRDPLKNLSRFEYDLNDRIVKSFDPMDNKTEFTYDGNGNLQTVKDANTGLTQYGYDQRNRQNLRTDPLGHSESWTYDGLGNVLTYIDRKGQLMQYSIVPYDALNRLKQINYADGSSTALTWDAGNRLGLIVDSVSGSIVRNYDLLDRLLSEQTPQGTVSYTYDAASRRATMTPAAQAQIVYTFDDANRLKLITQGTETVAISYDNANRRTTLILPNATSMSYIYNPANRLTEIDYLTTTTPLAAISYSYDAAGHRISQNRSGPALPGPILPTATTADGVFNINNEQTGSNGTTLAYDLNGNLTSDGTLTYMWDARDRLTTVKQGAVVKGLFAYDALGRRTTKSINGGTATNFLYDGWNPVQEVQGSATRPILTGLGIDEYFARTEASGRRYFLTDGLGSTVALTDSSQVVQQTYGYEPYGEVTATGASDNPYQYAGRENDGLGLYYYRARYYSPKLKRFIAEDPAGLRAGPNVYSYVKSGPLDRRDPWGLQGFPVGCMFQAGSAGCGPYVPLPPPDLPRPSPLTECLMICSLHQVIEIVWHDVAIDVGSWVIVETIPDVGQAITAAIIVWKWVPRIKHVLVAVEVPHSVMECVEECAGCPH